MLTLLSCVQWAQLGRHYADFSYDWSQYRWHRHSVWDALGLLVCWNIDAIKQFIERIADTTLFPAEIYYLAKLPAVVDFSEVLSVVAMALMLSFC